MVQRGSRHYNRIRARAKSLIILLVCGQPFASNGDETGSLKLKDGYKL